jgi:uroporphyrin-III C-methyltransferase
MQHCDSNADPDGLSIAGADRGRGKVWLIGAGPGDVELLTLKAVAALRQADVALVDDLVNEEVLQFLRAGVRIIRVGKRGWKGQCGLSTSQVFIEKQMILFARRGLTVARLKGGDPFVFGRGGEELQALQAAGIDVEVASGITAGIGVPAALGIPVTHRGLSHGVTLVTGHMRQDGGSDAPNWHALARCGTTLVIYMGIGNLAQIVSGLLYAGMAASTPLAVVQNGTRTDQRSLITHLGDAVDAVAQAKLGSPAIVVVGDVVRFAAAAEHRETARLVA